MYQNYPLWKLDVKKKKSTLMSMLYNDVQKGHKTARNKESLKFMLL